MGKGWKNNGPIFLAFGEDRSQIFSMPQIQLPVFPSGCEDINAHLAVERKGDQITYFNGHLPVFTHQADDVQSFRLFSTQLIVNGAATQAEIVRAFGVPSTTVKRYVKKYRLGGCKAIYEPPHRRQGTKLTPERLAEAQTLLDQEWSVPAISQQLDVLATTLHKAIDHGRLKKIDKKKAVKLKSHLPVPKPSVVSATKYHPWA